MTADDVTRRVTEVRATIEDACVRARRDPSEVTIVAAAKTVHPDLVRRAIVAGITAVGHNYVQELRRARD